MGDDKVVGVYVDVLTLDQLKDSKEPTTYYEEKQHETDS